VQQIIAGVHQLQASGGLTEWRTIVEFPRRLSARWIGLKRISIYSRITARRTDAGRTSRRVAGGIRHCDYAGRIRAFRAFFLYRDGEMAMRGCGRWCLSPMKKPPGCSAGSRIRF
jgi:hypothetical protein